ncbi:uncharacterized protein LOC114729752 [Neltuma alba]|uniref:uncharacterized protein LOC114729747 n=1 Tax=Neltuma alba TaxID=207710 RepID=UPI0010A4A16D|nr:uncharacterized protein LOC114729747 [Prosopis alba]XP_028772614.1 uncharacterized protein LOC114729747 [Prosopis alba]XP_028772619.1 uncharacterized protein LOC114729752 [Prosopis alba]XP_028772620.1 uncharacterized protein LOC114729752 [Prosopis alba]
MGTALASTALPLRGSHLFRYSFSLFRNFSSASSSASSASQNPTTSKKSKRRKKKNLFEVAQFLPNWGIGYHMAKTHWTDVSYEITKINLYKDGRHGKAWGIVHKNGLPAADAAKKISGVHKRCWRYIKNIVKSSESSPSSTGSADNGLKAETQAS